LVRIMLPQQSRIPMLSNLAPASPQPDSDDHRAVA
jgi:hypothetical protein